MPTKTFHNLSPEKKHRIAAAARKEFSASPFAEASINRIVKEAGISRGSFYMYFVDKYDLVFFLLEDFKSKFRAAVTTIGETSKGNLGKMMGDLHDLFHEAMSDSDNRNFISNFMIFSFSEKAWEQAGTCFSEEPFADLKHYVLNNIDRANIKDNFKDDPELIVDAVFLALKNVLGQTFIAGYGREESHKRFIRQLQLIQYGYLRNEE